MKTDYKINSDNKYKSELVDSLKEDLPEFSMPGITGKVINTFKRNRTAFMGGLILVSSSFIANILNFLYNAYLGRVLSFTDFAQIGLIGSFLSFASILFGAFTTTANYRNAYLIGKYGDNAGYSFWRIIRRKAIYISIAITILWLLLTPFLMNFFDAETPVLFWSFGLVLLVGLANGADRGFISAKFNFAGLAAINFLDPVIKLITAIVLVAIGLKFWTFSAVPFAVFGTFVLGWYLIVRNKNQKIINEHSREINYFSLKFFLASLLTGFSSIAFLSFDILLANHYLIPTEAGKYTLLSLVGRMIYFLGGLTTPFVIPIISRIEGANKSSKTSIYIIIFFTGLLAFIGFVSFGIFVYISIPLLYGKKAFTIVSFLPFFAFGMMNYTISKVLVNYYLVKKMVTFTVATSALVILQIILIQLFHSNAGTIGTVMASIWTIHLILTTSLHLFSHKVKKFENIVIGYFHK